MTPSRRADAYPLVGAVLVAAYFAYGVVGRLGRSLLPGAVQLGPSLDVLGASVRNRSLTVEQIRPAIAGDQAFEAFR